MQHLSQRLQESLPAAMLRRFIDTDLLAHSAALSFYALVSLAPLLLLVLWLTASLYPSAREALLMQISALAGPHAREVAGTVIESARARPDLGSLAGLWSTLLLFIGATVVFAQLQATLNRVFATATDELPGGVLVWLRKRVFSFGVVFALGFLLLVSMMLTTAMQVLFASLPWLVPAVANMITLLLYLVAFALLYRFLPDRRVRWRQALFGGALTAAMFVAGRWAIGLYLAYAAPGSAYGAFGTLVLLLVWIYYAALVFFVGALMTAVIDERVTRRPAARDDALTPAPPAKP
ncbi:MAG: YihY/virulence factor BrkB family protein [Arenimonas sp.]|uniref:YihY/virulence factor BrkB family protein n=1 Tax=Arenimonas sp. TaxID=1872635 RepID=UPI0025C71C9B|nr:YihY/virulence factor BrkB family protein [Arenimonas sp.]MBW8367632.1 YihY/virulence factor BrkB family protein [Arenimonas sp.]